MACCKGAEYDNWCDGVDIVWTDPETGEEYCLFHAPAEHKGMDEHEFSIKFTDYLNQMPSKWSSEEADSVYVDLRACVFICDITFADREFPIILFNNAIFLKDIAFKNINFKGEASFFSTRFDGNVFFDHVISESYFSFYNSHFSYDLSFTKFTALTGLSAHFKSPPNQIYLDISQCNDVLHFNSASEKSTLFILGDLDVKNSKACIEINEFKLDGLEVGSLITFPLKIKNSKIDFFHSDFYRILAPISFQGCSFKKLFLSATTLKNIVFSDCKFPKLNSRTTTSDTLSFIFNSSQPPSKKASELEELYRALKKQAQNEEARIQASDWHYWEKYFYEKRIFTEGTAIEWGILRIYRILSDYGENVEKASGWLFALILAPLIVVYISQLPSPDINFMNIAKEGLDYIPLATRAPIEGSWSRFFQIFWQVLITFQATLLGFALRNRYRR